MQYEQVYRLVDNIFAVYEGRGNEECDSVKAFMHTVSRACVAEENGYDDEMVTAVFLLDIEHFIKTQKQAGALHSGLCNDPFLRRQTKLPSWEDKMGNIRPAADEDIWRMKEIITRYLVSL